MIVAALVEPASLRALGSGLSVPALCLSVGLVVYAAVVHRGTPAELLALGKAALVAAAVAVVGSALEIAGVAQLLGVDWMSAVTDGHVPGPMLRMVGAALIVVGLFEGIDARLAASAADGRDARWSLAGSPAIALAGAPVGVLSFAFDGHTVSTGPRLAHALVSTLHAGAASVWVGGTAALAAVAWWRRHDTDRGGLAALTRAVGRIGAVAVAAAAITGVGMSLWITDGRSDLAGSRWGRTLLAKLVIVAAVVVLGAVHGFRERGVGAGGRAGARAALAVEAVLLLAAAIVTSVLVRAASG